MTIRTLCALTIPMCRMARDPQVMMAAAKAAERMDDAHFRALLAEMRHFPEELDTVLGLLGCSGVTEELMLHMSNGLPGFLHLCGQCSPGEMLDVLSRCQWKIGAEELALLISRRRRELAMARYGLQLLWRLCGDDTIPDALTLFPDDAPCQEETDAISRLIVRLEGGDGHG